MGGPRTGRIYLFNVCCDRILTTERGSYEVGSDGESAMMRPMGQRGCPCVHTVDLSIVQEGKKFFTDRHIPFQFTCMHPDLRRSGTCRGGGSRRLLVGGSWTFSPV